MDDDKKRVLISVDLTDQSGPVITQGLRAARAFGADIVLMHAVHQLQDMYGIYLGAGSVSSLQHDIETQAKESLAALRQKHLGDVRDVAVTEEVRIGRPWTEVLAAALHHRAGLIVLGAHFAAKPEHRVLGSTAEHILRQAPCPILVVPPEAFDMLGDVVAPSFDMLGDVIAPSPGVLGDVIAPSPGVLGDVEIRDPGEEFQVQP